MKERGILFSAPMVRAILDGRKTQTRRVVNPQPETGQEIRKGNHPNPDSDWWLVKHDPLNTWQPLGRPFGVPGDRLWARETHYRYGHWEQVDGPRKRTRTGRQRWRFVADTSEVRFDAPAEFRKGRHHKDPVTPAWHKRLARFMPRALSRITLEIDDLHVQRLQEISEDDARAEGVTGDAFCNHRITLSVLWEQINGKRAPWSSNPWVWCLTFRRVER